MSSASDAAQIKTRREIVDGKLPPFRCITGYPQGTTPPTSPALAPANAGFQVEFCLPTGGSSRLFDLLLFEEVKEPCTSPKLIRMH